MEKKLNSLFEFQRFVGNPGLAQLIEETERRYGEALSDDDISLVNAAGDLLPERTEKKDDTKKQ